jgi:predicted TPR repeat methyltransferase
MSCVSTMASARLRTEADPLSEARDLIENGRASDATEILERVTASGRGGLLARTLLVRALLSGARNKEALAQAREASQLFPTAAAAALALGVALLAAGQLPTAIAEMQRALRIDPTLNEARYQLGCAWLEAGEPEKALQEFAAASRDEAPAGLAQRITEAEAMIAAPRSNAGYVRHLFDQFSADYDMRMIAQLGYSAPQVLRNLAATVLPDVRSLTILDLGCGTGLAGVAFADLAARLHGIDLSPAMIEKARTREIYNDLAVTDIEAVLPTNTYDLVIAADTLVYLGDLKRLFRNVDAALKGEGSFLFTAERAEGDDYFLGPKRRWRHSEGYLRSLAARVGFEISGLIACTPRMEAGVPVDGLAVALRKPG